MHLRFVLFNYRGVPIVVDMVVIVLVIIELAVVWNDEKLIAALSFIDVHFFTRKFIVHCRDDS